MFEAKLPSSAGAQSQLPQALMLTQTHFFLALRRCHPREGGNLVLRHSIQQR